MTTETETGSDPYVVERLVEAGALIGPDDARRKEAVEAFRRWVLSATTSSPADAGLWASRLTDDFLRQVTDARPEIAYGGESAEEE